MVEIPRIESTFARKGELVGGEWMKIKNDVTRVFLLMTLLFLLIFAVLIPLTYLIEPIFALPNSGIFIWIKPLALLLVSIGGFFVISVVGFKLFERFS